MRRRVLFELLVVTLSFLYREVVTTSDEELFHYSNYSEIVSQLYKLNASYQHLVDLTIVQDQYNLPYPKELQCPQDIEEERNHSHPNACKQYLLRLTNKNLTKNNFQTPEIFFSGALHGNERIGPSTLIELANFLVTSHNKNIQWLNHFVDTRVIYMMVMTNAYGYYHNTRQELNVDPNRDFVYENENKKQCMQSMTARSVNEVWRDHLFSLAITFHAGMKAIAYEWGSPNHMLHHNHDKSPDHVAQQKLAEAMANTGGIVMSASKQTQQNYYPTGMMNDIVYGVTGGMEDWAYAASWENQFLEQENRNNPTKKKVNNLFPSCNPSTFGGYNSSKTIYNNMTHRTFNFLIETSDAKEPHPSTLGLKKNIYNLDLLYKSLYVNDKKMELGHITRNLRISLLLLDLAQPYIIWKQNRTRSLKNDNCSANICNYTDGVCHVNTSSLFFQWDVLGSLTVDSTHLLISTKKIFPANETNLTSKQTGITGLNRFTSNENYNTEYGDCIRFPHTGVYYIQAVATVDQNFANHNTKYLSPGNTGPQSHFVNARTNANWHFKLLNSEVQGHLQWNSTILTVNFTTASKYGQPHSNNSSRTPATNAHRLNQTINRTERTTINGTEGREHLNISIPNRTTKTNQTIKSETSNNSTGVLATANVTKSSAKKKILDTSSKISSKHYSTDALMLGYMVLGIGGFIMLLSGLFLYFRVFKSTDYNNANNSNQKYEPVMVKDSEDSNEVSIQQVV